MIKLKPVSKGYKIWPIADRGYIIDFLWHQPGAGKKEGPQGLNYWALSSWHDHGFAKTQAVVL